MKTHDTEEIYWLEDVNDCMVHTTAATQNTHMAEAQNLLNNAIFNSVMFTSSYHLLHVINKNIYNVKK